jgi:galactose oxidase
LPNAAAQPDAFTPKADALSPAGWTATASDQQSTYPASNAIDGRMATIWHSQYSPTLVALPHSITVDMHAVNNVSGLTYEPRQDTSPNGTIGQYSISVSTDGTNFSPVTSGTWADDKTVKAAVFAGLSARYVRLTALTEAGNRGQWTSAAEIGILGNPAIGPALSHIGWTATADSQASATYAASNVLDGDALTIWHTPWNGTVPPLPHYITIDMKTAQVISGFSYMPRQDSSLNGTIGNYAVSVSNDGSTWSQVASGTWANDHTPKYAVFSPISAEFVRLTALTESGNRGPWTSAAEINIHGQAPAPGVGGKWDAPIGFPLVPVSAMMLPNNKVLTFSAYTDTSFTATQDTIRSRSSISIPAR